MGVVRWIFGTLWRAWFLLINLIFLVVTTPLLVISVALPSLEMLYFSFARAWAWWNLVLMGFWPKARYFHRPKKHEQFIVVANHSSYLDIMLIIALCPFPVLFIGKVELGRIPLFGYFYRKMYLMVDRKSLASKRQVMERAAQKLREGYSLCIFPEGGIPAPEVRLANFRLGAFKLALETGVPLLPMAFANNKRAFPDDLDKGKPGFLHAIVDQPLRVDGLLPGDIERLKDDCHRVIDKALSLQGY